MTTFASAAAEVARRDRTMAKLMHRTGSFRLPKPTADHFAALAESILYQQLAGAAAILVTANLVDLHPHLRQASRVEVIAIPLPDHATRRGYIEALLRENGFELGMTPDQLAHATGGLSLLHLEHLCRSA